MTPALALLLEAITDRKAQRRLIGRLSRLAGRPHPIVRLPRRRLMKRQCAGLSMAPCPGPLATR
jgi:hypothetical protein